MEHGRRRNGAQVGGQPDVRPPELGAALRDPGARLPRLCPRQRRLCLLTERAEALHRRLGCSVRAAPIPELCERVEDDGRGAGGVAEAEEEKAGVVVVGQLGAGGEIGLDVVWRRDVRGAEMRLPDERVADETQEEVRVEDFAVLCCREGVLDVVLAESHAVLWVVDRLGMQLKANEVEAADEDEEGSRRGGRRRGGQGRERRG